MDMCEDDLRTRRGKFLNVEKEGSLYRETHANGEIIECAPSKHPLEIGVEAMAVHATSDVASGAVRHLLTGSTREQFRAIGTEGSYKIFDVSIGSATPTGTILIRKTYDYDGHALRSKMIIGLQEETITQFENSLPGILRLGGIEGQTSYNTDPSGEAVMLNHWREHVVSDDGSEYVVAEWQFTFTTASFPLKAIQNGYRGCLTARHLRTNGMWLAISGFTTLANTLSAKPSKLWRRAPRLWRRTSSNSAKTFLTHYSP